MKTITTSLIIFLNSFLLLLFIAGCSSKTDKEYFEIANKDINTKNYDKAIQSYENLVKEYPESNLAPESLFKLASLYQSHLINSIPMRQSLEKAAQLYGEVFDKYPESPKASQALFLKGFILANDLNEYDQAKNAYTLFLKKYPNNDLAPSAKEELEHLGMSPDQILKEKSAKPV